MRIVVTDDDGTVFDTTDVTPEDWHFELEHHPHGILAQMDVPAVEDDSLQPVRSDG